MKHSYATYEYVCLLWALPSQTCHLLDSTNFKNLLCLFYKTRKNAGVKFVIRCMGPIWALLVLRVTFVCGTSSVTWCFYEELCHFQGKILFCLELSFEELVIKKMKVVPTSLKNNVWGNFGHNWSKTLLVFPHPTGEKLQSYGFSSLMWDVFHKIL